MIHNDLLTIIAQAAPTAPAAPTSSFKNTAAAIISIAWLFAGYFALPLVVRGSLGFLGTIAGAVNDRSRGGFDRLKKYRQGKSAKNTQNLMAGTRFNPQSKFTRALGGGLINRAGGRVGGMASTGRLWGNAAEAARANRSTSDAGSMAKENHDFARQMNNEGAMAALAFGGNRAKLKQLEHYKDKNADGSYKYDDKGNIKYKEDALDADIGAARSVGFNQRTATAGADALAQSGKVLSNRDEAQMLYASLSGSRVVESRDPQTGEIKKTVQGGNQSLYQAMKGSYQYTSRQKGRNDIGRDSDFAALEEMNVSSISQLKPMAAQNILPQIHTVLQNGVDDKGRQLNQGQKQHLVNLLYSAQYSPYTNMYQQNAVQSAVVAVQTQNPAPQNGQPQPIINNRGMPVKAPPGVPEDMWHQASVDYSSKMGRPGDDTNERVARGEGPGGPGPGGP